MFIGYNDLSSKLRAPTAANSAKHDARSFGKAKVETEISNRKVLAPPRIGAGKEMSHPQSPVRGGVLCADVMCHLRSETNRPNEEIE
jgi:hypothetical protein